MYFKNQPDIVYGAAAIAREMNLFDESGEPAERKAYHMLENGYVAGAQKMGNIWALSVPTFRRAMHGDVADTLPAQTLNAEATQAESESDEATEDEARRREDGEEEAEADAPEAG